MSAQAPIATPHEDLNAVLAKVGELARRSAGGSYIYRGEPKAYPAVSSSLYRRYEDIEADAFDIEVVQREILGQARGYTRYTGETDELEILSQIQHNGGDTNLIDFTTDFLIALFFACDGDPGEPGRVILLSENGADYQVMEPREPAHRVIAQKSVFVRPSKGFVEPNDIVDISSNLKQSVLDYLREAHGIFTETIYNDLHGFIRHQGIHQSAYVEFYKGVTASRRENYLQAVEHYNRAIELNPQLIPAYNNRGIACYRTGDYESAIRNYDRALELNPEDPITYYNLGVIHDYRGDYESAIRNYDRALELNPEYPAPYCNLGVIHSYRGDYESAIQNYNRALELDPEYPAPYCNLGIIQAYRGDYESAIQNYNRAIALDPEEPGFYCNRGEAWLHLGELDNAREDLATAQNMGDDIVASFRNEYASVADFEQRNGITLPPDIAEMLGG